MDGARSSQSALLSPRDEVELKLEVRDPVSQWPPAASIILARINILDLVSDLSLSRSHAQMMLAITILRVIEPHPMITLLPLLLSVQ